jgi:hypothetical protein
VTIEQSKGKARPALVRSSDLRTSESVRKPTDGRTADGRFAAGNRVSVGAGFKRTAKKLLGPESAGGEDERVVRRDAWRVFVATMRTMPSDAAPVRSLVGLHARHIALAALYAAKASEAGLATAAGMKLQEAADRQSQRAERVLVTALDVARVCAASAEEQRPNGLALLHAAADAREIDHDDEGSQR